MNREHHRIFLITLYKTSTCFFLVRILDMIVIHIIKYSSHYTNMNNNAISSIHSDLSLDTKEEKLTVHILNVAQRKNIESDIPV